MTTDLRRQIRQAERELPLSITLPLPPMSLSKNGRSHWAKRNRDFQNWRLWAGRLIQSQFQGPHSLTCDIGMDIEWKYSRGRAPDRDNCITRCSAIADAAEAVGLIVNDRQIVEGRYTTERVKAGEECVVIVFRVAAKEQAA